MVLGACIQVPLTGCLVMGAFGLPALGIVGAAVSAIVSAAILSLVFLWRLIWGRQTLKLHWHARVLSRELFRDISKVAVPASLSPLLTILTVLSLTSLVGRFGEAALAGYGIGSRVEMLLVPLVFGLGAAMTSLVGLSLGAGNLARAERIGWLGGTMAAGVAGILGLLLALFPSAWIGAFTSDPATFAAAKSYIQIVGPCFALQGLGLSLYFASQGAGRMAWPILATILRILLSVGGALLLAFYFDFGLKGIYIAAGTGMVAYGVMIGAGLKLGAWR
jgi:Na+-driven multidrug efflux pump